MAYRTKVWREGYGEVELPLGAQHLNSLGVVHGGVFASLLDVALGHAVSFSPVPGNTRYSTTCLFPPLSKAPQADIDGVGPAGGVTGRMVTATGEVRDEAGALLAVAQGSFLYFPGSEQPAGVPKRSAHREPSGGGATEGRAPCGAR